MLTWLKLRWHAAKLNGSATGVERRSLRVLANLSDPRAHQLLVDELAKWGRGSEQFRRLGGQDSRFLQDARGVVVEAMGQVRRPSPAIIESITFALFDHAPARKAAVDALSTRLADVASVKLPAVLEELHRNYEASRSRIYCFDEGLCAAAAVLRRIDTLESLNGLFRMLGLGAEARHRL